MNNNERTVNVKITRGELCGLLLACTAAIITGGGESEKKWTELHQKLLGILNENDEKNSEQGLD